MLNIPRTLENEILKASRAFGALLLTGPRRSGKTTLLRRLFPKADYRLLEDLDELDRVRQDPKGYLASLKNPVILDEIQNAPQLFNYVRTRIDAQPRLKGRWIFTGSQEAPLMQGVSESMAGRVAVFQLLPFSRDESPKVSLLGGGFPEALARPAQAQRWFASYLQTYLERDVRSAGGIKDLGAFRRFMALLATRCGQMLNRSDLAGPLGVAVSTVSDWVSILELTSQVILLQPFYENLGKRLVKSPKVYFADTGLAAHLLGLQGPGHLRSSPFLGPLFENLVVSELAKAQINQGRRRELYYFRDQQGLEVDVVLPQGAGRLALIEAKATQTPLPSMAKPLLTLKSAAKRYQCQAYVVHQGGAEASFRGLGPGVLSMPWTELSGLITTQRTKR